MGRSLRVKSEMIKQVKAAVTRNGFPSQAALASEIGLSRDVMSRFLNGKPVDYLNAEEICRVLGLDLGDTTGYGQLTPAPKRRIDWGDATDTTDLSEREQELKTLKKWIVEDRCRLVLIDGMKGMGKTNLSYKLGKLIQDDFDFVIWRSLDQYPFIIDLLKDLLELFTSDQNEESNAKTFDELQENLNIYLKQYRCLLILTNIDIVLENCSFAPQHIEYERLIKWIVEQQEKSCLVITSCVELKEISLIKQNQFVNFLKIEPLSIEAVKTIFSDVGNFIGADEDWSRLQNTYHGNPFALKNIAVNIQTHFGGSISHFIEFGEFVFNGVEEFLDEQLNYLSVIEEEVMYWLAIYRHPINIFELKDIVYGIFGDQLLNIIKHLKLRFFVEGEGEGTLIQPPMIREYFLKRLINETGQEIIQNQLSLLTRFPLLITTAKGIVRKDQEKFLLEPIIASLKSKFGTEREVQRNLENLLIQGQLNGYATGNLINLLRHLECGYKFENQNFVNLIIKNANFRDLKLHNTNFSNTDLSGSIFLDTFSKVLSVAFSPNGRFLAIGDTNDQIFIWEVTENRPVLRQILLSNSHWVRAITFSPDSKMIAIGGEDGKVYLREIETAKQIAVFEGHIDRVRSLTFSHDGKFIASSSDDRTVRIWDLNRRQLINVSIQHQDKVRIVVFHPDGKTLISASQDNYIQIWKINSESAQFVRSLTLPIPFLPRPKKNTANLLRAIVINPDGKIIATGNDDGIVRFWNLETGEFIQDLRGHTNWIRSLAWSPDGKFIASASEDETIQIWDPSNGQCLQILRGHTGRVWSVAFHPSRPWLVSGDDGMKIKFWHVTTGECLGAFKGYSQQTRPIAFSPDGMILATGNNQATVGLKNSKTGEIQETIPTDGGNIWSLAYSSDGHILVGGSDDTKIYIWDLLGTNRSPILLSGHSNWVRTVAVSPDGQHIVSGSDDKTVKLWNSHNYKCIATFEGHTDWIRSVSFIPNNSLLVSGSDDGTIKVWNIKTKNLEQILRSNQHQIWTIGVNLEGNLLASGSNDNTITLWDLKTYQPITTLIKHRNWISSVAFSPDSRFLASGSHDTTIRLWELASGEYKCHKILQGHGKAVISIAFHPTEPILVSSSKDGTIKRWNIETGECLATWRTPRPYEGMNITGVTGITDAQKQSLKALGAIEDSHSQTLL